MKFRSGNDKERWMEPGKSIESLLLSLRGQLVLLDSDLAAIYGVSTGRFNEAVKRNLKRFPEDFSFILTRAEFDSLISQNAISKPARGGRTKLPRVFTEHGALQARRRQLRLDEVREQRRESELRGEADSAPHRGRRGHEY